MTIQQKFKSAKNDINATWNYSDSSERISRDWIYGVDPETMAFVRAMFTFMPGDYSLYKTFISVMKAKTLEELL